ncbi:MAG: hypothetical protein J6J77_06035 [Alistipes sp.]|nr:hypothetical protein [Alistipes sp.]
MRRIIFLDFDGVLNTEYYQGLLQFQGEQWQDQYGAFFDPRAVRQLKRVIDTTGADIVVESSWKYLGLEAMQELWRVRDLPGRVIDITPSLTKNKNKGDEIAAWLSEHATPDTRYVIIDDEYVVLDTQIPYFILTNSYEGLTEEQANRAISILHRWL